MNLIQITETCFYFQGVVNIGYVNHGDEGLLIDAGIDKTTMKKIIKKLEEHQYPITHLYITHAHTDHFGGASYLQTTKQVHTMAPELEEAILRYPILEPIYLFQGNTPLQEMRNKFLEGEAIAVNEVLTEGTYTIDGFTFSIIGFPGHSENQMGILIDDILYCGDAYFGMEQLHKHKIPYIVDAEQTLQSLEKLKTIQCSGAVPGHGVYETKFIETVNQNITYHSEILDSIHVIFDVREGALSHEKLIRAMCDRWKVTITHVSAWLLYRTAITAYLTKLVKDQNVTIQIQDNTLTFDKNNQKIEEG